MNKYVTMQVNVYATRTKPVEKKLRFGVLADKSRRRIISSFDKSGGAFAQVRCSILPELFNIDISINIQGVTGGTDQTSGECSLGQTIPI